MSLSFTIRLSDGSRFDVTLLESSLESTAVRKIKEAIHSERADLPVDQQRLIYKGKILDNDRILTDYGMVNQATLHLVMARATTATPPAAATATTTATTTTAGTDTTTAANNITAAVPSLATPPPTSIPPASNPLLNPFGASNLFGRPSTNSNNNLWQQLQQQQQQQMLQDPEMMQQMLNSPLMQNLLDNPQLFQNMMEMNPQVRQLLDQNPELRQVFQDPQLMRQSMDLMRNPQHMQYLMRQQDLAMSQLENLPGGFSALSNLYHNVQEPMMEAMQDGNRPTVTGGAAGASSTTTPSTASAMAGATGAAMPNPWGSPASSARSTRPVASSPNTRSGITIPSTATSSSTTTTAATSQTPPVPEGSAAFAASSSPWNFPMIPPPPMAGGMVPPTPAMLEQTLQTLEQNPRMQQVLDQIFSNPEMIQTMLGSSPMMQLLRQENPAAYNLMMQNPQILRNMMNPQQLRMMMQVQQAMQPPAGGPTPGSAVAPFMSPWGLAPAGLNPFGPISGSGAAASPPGAAPLDFSNLLAQYQSLGLGGLGGGSSAVPGLGGIGAGAAGPPLSTPPADRFRHQLRSLYDMGFDDEQANSAALQLHHGNVNRAVDALLTGTVPRTATATVPTASTPPVTTTTTPESAAPSPPTSDSTDGTGSSNDQSDSQVDHPNKEATEKKND